MRVLSRMWQMLLKGITEARAATRPAAAAEWCWCVSPMSQTCRRRTKRSKMLEQNGGASPAMQGTVRRAARRRRALLRCSRHLRAGAFPPRVPSADISPRPQISAPMPEAASAPAGSGSQAFPELVALALTNATC